MSILSETAEVSTEAPTGAEAGAVQTSSGEATQTQPDEVAKENSEAPAEKVEAEGAEASADKSADNDGEAEGASAPTIDYDALTVPEGFELDGQALELAKPVLEEMGVTDQAQAQKLVDLFAGIQKQQAEAAAETLTKTHEEWVGAIKSDWGNAFDERLAVAAKAVELGGDELREALALTGAGNHPAVIKFFHRVGTAISEDGLVAGDAKLSSKSPLEKRLYPSMKG
jgi:hypothetical protein